MTATPAPAKALAPAQAPPRTDDEAYLSRTPSLRCAMILRVPDRKTTGVGMVTVTEQAKTVILAIEEFNGIMREIPLTLREARAVADNLNRICRRVATRKAGAP